VQRLLLEPGCIKPKEPDRSSSYNSSPAPFTATGSLPIVAPKRYTYIKLAGLHSVNPESWSLGELRDTIDLFISHIKATDRLVIFIDGLDEYEGDLENLIAWLKQLHHGHNVKLCVSSRPWNVFRDAFHTYPSLSMELFTRPDIKTYVCTCMGNSLAFQELRILDAASVEKLQSQIIKKADGVFLWVVLVVAKVINTARDNNDLHEIWKVFESLPPGLEELYSSMRRRLDPTHREVASRMYQLLFRWNEKIGRPLDVVGFWVAINCHNPTELQPIPTVSGHAGAAIHVPALERRMAGATGGIVQLIHGHGKIEV